MFVLAAVVAFRGVAGGFAMGRWVIGSGGGGPNFQWAQIPNSDTTCCSLVAMGYQGSIYHIGTEGPVPRMAALKGWPPDAYVVNKINSLFSAAGDSNVPSYAFSAMCKIIYSFVYT